MSYNHALIDGDYTKPTPASPKRWERSFEDDPRFYVYTQTFNQQEKYFVPAIDYPPEVVSAIGQVGKVPPIDNTVHRCVGEGNLTSIGAGIVSWDRTYARTPNTRFVWESYNWKVPGIATAVNEGLFSINALTSTQGPTVTTIKTTAAHGASVNDWVSITYYGVANAVTFHRSVLKKVVTVADTTTFTIAKITDDILVESGLLAWKLVQVGATRVPSLRTVTSKTVNEYFTVGDLVSTPDNVIILMKEQAIGSDGVETDTYSPLTTPTAAQFRATIGQWRVAEDSILRQWKGPIYERSTRYVKTL
jgi:hypothetical protein